MKNLFLLIFLFIGIAASAQAPEKMSYQAVIRDANGALLKSQNVNIQFTVNQTSESGTIVYQESQTPTTNSNGLVSVYMGTGTVSSGDFSTIDWSKGPYFLQSEIDPTGGTNYTISSTTELVSVPYAVYANKAEFADSLTGGVNETDPIFDASVAKGVTAIDTAYWNSKLDSSSIQNFVDLTTNQTVAGAKTFSSDLTVNGMTVGKGGGAIASNTANGINALYSNTTGFSNTANGKSALYSNTTGDENTANGVYALESNTTGGGNTANGVYALFSNTTGYYNTANGYRALESNTTGEDNTANGYYALESNTTGEDNTANGYYALYSNTTGEDNTANGVYALFSNTTGNNNTAIGYQADVAANNLSNATAIGNGASVASSNTIQLGNTSVTNVKTSGTITAGAITIPNTDGTANQVLKTDGSGTLSWSTPSSGGVPYTGATGAVNLGAYDLKVNGITVGKGGGAIATNTATGNFALRINTTGSNNTATGKEALSSNTTGNNNTANGRQALLSNTTGYWNTANGSGALRQNTTGSFNTANGVNALFSNTSGNNNTANGTRALQSNTTGSFNTANGYEALFSNTTGSFNTANGYRALESNTTGYYNTALGYKANVSSGNLSNATAIGYSAIVSASNTVRIGNSSVSRIGGNVAWTNLSDGRIKENVQEAVPGLSFIAELRPVTYTLNTRKQDEITMQAMPDSIKERRMLSDADYLESSSIVRTGFIAQEVEAAAKKVGFDFDGVSTPENETDLYGIRYAEFVVPLVKAMQEQQEMIDGQQATIEQQKSDYMLLLKRIEALEKE